jgi:hypothetical protein
LAGIPGGGNPVFLHYVSRPAERNGEQGRQEWPAQRERSLQATSEPAGA